jgi:hypothetical protein
MGILEGLLKVHAGEGRKVFFFALLGALLDAGIALGISTADSLFLVHLGADRLPVVCFLLPLIMVAFIPALRVPLGHQPLHALSIGTLSTAISTS